MAKNNGNVGKFYIDPKEMFAEILKSQKNGQTTDTLARMFMLLSERYTNHYQFSRYIHLKEDLISVGCLACVRSMPKFRPYRDREMVWDGGGLEYHHTITNNPFAFFTTCIKNDFRLYLKKMYQQKNIVNEVKLEEGLEPDHGYEDVVKGQKEKAERSKK